MRWRAAMMESRVTELCWSKVVSWLLKNENAIDARERDGCCWRFSFVSFGMLVAPVSERKVPRVRQRTLKGPIRV
jgi:hypothetical protein